MKNTIRLILVLLIVSSTVFAQNAGESAPQCWTRDYECFIREYGKRIAAAPADAENYLQRGINLIEKFRYSEALKDFDKFVELSPKSAKGYFYRGEIYMLRANYTRAVTEFDRAIELKPDFSGAFYSRGRSNFFLKDFVAALSDFKRTIELNPDHLSNYVARGEVYKIRGERELSEIDFKYVLDESLKIAAAAPEDSRANAQLAYAYFFKRDYYQAINFYTKAIDSNLDGYQNYYYRGSAYFSVGRSDLALADFNRGIEITPEYAEFYAQRAKVFEKTGEREKARADLKKYEELSKM